MGEPDYEPDEIGYTPKVGDRVRATHAVEGTVINTVDDTWSYVEVKTDDGLRYELHDDDSWSFEKLADPEPKWVNGDVILVIGEGGKRTPLIYVANDEGDRFWACAECTRGSHPLQHVSADWSNGDVVILHKQP